MIKTETDVAYLVRNIISFTSQDRQKQKKNLNQDS
jgi:hypothetical protein